MQQKAALAVLDATFPARPKRLGFQHLVNATPALHISTSSPSTASRLGVPNILIQLMPGEKRRGFAFTVHAHREMNI